MIEDAGFVFVLVRPRQAGNVGAVARALKNCGMGGLRIVADADPKTIRAARMMAVHAADVLADARVYPSLADALADCNVAIGTTARGGPYRAGARTPRDVAANLCAEARTNRVAIIFGPEDRGLTNDELKNCHRLITIPTDPAYSSLNLAQAVMVVAYELRLAALDAARDTAADDASTDVLPLRRAGAADVDAMFDRLSRALLTIGFLPEDNPDHLMFTLREVFGRAGLSPRELDILSGIARQIEWFATGGHLTIADKRRAGRRVK